jgi:hypothetical protein
LVFDRNTDVTVVTDLKDFLILKSLLLIFDFVIAISLLLLFLLIFAIDIENDRNTDLTDLKDFH